MRDLVALLLMLAVGLMLGIAYHPTPASYCLSRPWLDVTPPC